MSLKPFLLKSKINLLTDSESLNLNLTFDEVSKAIDKCNLVIPNEAIKKDYWVCLDFSLEITRLLAELPRYQGGWWGWQW